MQNCNFCGASLRKTYPFHRSTAKFLLQHSPAFSLASRISWMKASWLESGCNSPSLPSKHCKVPIQVNLVNSVGETGKLHGLHCKFLVSKLQKHLEICPQKFPHWWHMCLFIHPCILYSHWIFTLLLDDTRLILVTKWKASSIHIPIKCLPLFLEDSLE